MYNVPKKHFFYKESNEKTSIYIHSFLLFVTSFERNVFSCYNHRR
ncbi:hypothetical protein HMPREF1992_00700 [Selenomonas sp. oral taxon 892 str. F0426]|nr:hypothetical protein HMPREF1992_00700 [Selenomonas sp. oral taxon 892 str. F0426]